MSIVTKTGDRGETALMYNRRVSKCHPRVEAYGAVDELNAALGLARASVKEPLIANDLLVIKQDLVVLMGELATAIEDLPRYLKDGFSQVSPAMTTKLEALVTRIEPQTAAVRGWAMPGATVGSSALDIARTVCRRAERGVCALQNTGQLSNPEIVVYLNRLSDVLWLMARLQEKGGA